MGNVQIVSTLQNKAAQKKSIFYSSSTVFLGVYNHEHNLDTEVSLLNHFILKRGVSDVISTFELRDLNGELISSFRVAMDEERAYSVRLGDYVKSNFLGSIYVFFKSSENLAVPFCAVMCSIKAPNSVCGVHTYGRCLEEKELGTGIDLQNTVETGWTIRDTTAVKSFAVLHGGQFELELSIRIECSNSSGTIILIEKDLVLPKFGTLLLVPQELSTDIVRHLQGKKGHAKVAIKGLSGIFPRMLCGNFSVGDNRSDNLIDASEIQFTHTNFDFSTIKQPNAGGNFGYYNQPSLPDGYGIIYPVDTTNDISINNENYLPNTLHHINIDPMSQVEIKAKNGNLPSRFVSAAVGIWDNATLESECSTGTFIEDYLKVPCHWHWGLLKPGLENGESEISIILNNFNRNKSLSRSLKLRIFDEERLLVECDVLVDGHKKISTIDLLPPKLPDGVLWYVLSGDSLEDLNIYSTFYPVGKAGFTEHAF